MNKIKAVIVDDEPLARDGLRIRLEKTGMVDIVDEAGNVDDALTAIERSGANVVFLDIEMPGETGLVLSKKLESVGSPLVVFVTAYKNYAVEAFEVHAVDYLVKPVSQERLAQTVKVLSQRVQERRLLHDKQALIQAVWEITGKPVSEIEHMLDMGESIHNGYADKLAIKDPGNVTKLIPCSEIDWIEAAGDYMCVNANGQTYILRSTMKELESQLNPAMFQRIHRSSLVNRKSVIELKSHSNGESFITLINGQKLKVSRSYKKKIDDFL